VKCNSLIVVFMNCICVVFIVCSMSPIVYVVLCFILAWCVILCKCNSFLIVVFMNCICVVFIVCSVSLLFM
jgi:hypothetical protein